MASFSRRLPSIGHLHKGLCSFWPSLWKQDTEYGCGATINFCRRRSMSSCAVSPGNASNKRKGNPKKRLRRNSSYMADIGASKRPKRLDTFFYDMSSFAAIADHPKSFYVDKTRYIPPLEGLGKAVLMLAPRRFGKSLFLDTLAHYYDISLKDDFERLFGKLWIGRGPTKSANTYHVLQLSFRSLYCRHASEFGESISHCLHTAINEFCGRYNIPIPGGTMSITSVCELLKAKGETLMILIDDYDGFVTRLRAQNPKGEATLTQMQTTFYDLFSIFKMCLDMGNATIYMTGMFPLKLTAKDDSGFNEVACHHPWGKLAKLFGFTMDDVYKGVERLDISSTCSEEELVRHLAALHLGYRFRRCALKTLFNPSRIQFTLHHLSLHAKYDPTMTTQKLLKGLNAIVEPFTSATITALSLASAHPLLPWVLRESLYSTCGTKALELDKFDFSDFGLLRSASKSALLSFLYFSGVLTHEIVPDYQHPYRLSACTGYHRTELLASLRQLIEARPGSLSNLHASIQMLSNTHRVEPLIICLQDQLQTCVESYDISVLEHELRTLTYTSIMMCCLQNDEVYSEAKIESNSGDKVESQIPFKNMYGSEDQYVVLRKALNSFYAIKTEHLVADGPWLENTSIASMRYLFHFRVIPVAYIKDFVDVKWEQRLEANRTLSQLTDDAIGNLEYHEAYNQPFKKISTCMEEARKEVERKIQLMNQAEAAEPRDGMVIGVAIVRVGLYRLMSSIVNPENIQPGFVQTIEE